MHIHRKLVAKIGDVWARKEIIFNATKKILNGITMSSTRLGGDSSEIRHMP